MLDFERSPLYAVAMPAQRVKFVCERMNDVSSVLSLRFLGIINKQVIRFQCRSRIKEFGITLEVGLIESEKNLEPFPISFLSFLPLLL